MNVAFGAPARETGHESGAADEDGPSRRSEPLKRLLAGAATLFPRPMSAMASWRGAANDAPKRAAEAEERERGALVGKVRALKTMRVDDVMVPRADIVAIEASASLEETMEAFRLGQHSRLPVYRDQLDDPIGVVHLKDLAFAYGFGSGSEEAAEAFSLEAHVRGMLVVPPSMRVQTLLERMQATRRHMALVIDEYGGVDGLVTIEDILEQIVGEIDDEHDDADRPLWTKLSDGSFMADARAEVSDFQVALGATLLEQQWDEEIDTLGGLIFMICGRVPTRGEVIAHPAGFEFEIIDADPRRIKRLRVRPAPERPVDAGPTAGAAVAVAVDEAVGEEQTEGDAAPEPTEAAPRREELCFEDDLYEPESRREAPVDAGVEPAADAAVSEESAGGPEAGVENAAADGAGAEAQTDAAQSAESAAHGRQPR